MLVLSDRVVFADHNQEWNRDFRNKSVTKAYVKLFLPTSIPVQIMPTFVPKHLGPDFVIEGKRRPV